jgi:hypothetical protein
MPWRVAASKVRLRNSRTQREGRSERYAVDSDTLMCGVLRGDKLVWANDCYRRTLGYRTMAELYDTPIWDYIAPESHEMVLRRMDRLQNTIEHSRQVRYTFQGTNKKRLDLIMYTVDTWYDGGVMCRACVAGESGKTPRGAEWMTKAEADVYDRTIAELRSYPHSDATRAASSISRSA